jgi:leader peptidase (prepilin peptidase) / N-methyltransferase
MPAGLVIVSPVCRHPEYRPRPVDSLTQDRCDRRYGPAVHLVTGFIGAAIGVVLAPTLAALTVAVPADGPNWPTGWWHGGTATRQRLLLIGALAAVVLAMVGGGIGWRAWLPAYLWLAASAVALAVIDIEHHRLPDALTFPAYGAGIVLLGIAAATGHPTPYLHALIGMAAVFALFFVLAFLGGIGFGDTKLAGVLGLYLGWFGYGPLVLGFVAGFCIGALVALALLAVKAAGWKTDIAFGPSLLAGALLSVLFGRHVVNAYLHLH